MRILRQWLQKQPTVSAKSMDEKLQQIDQKIVSTLPSEIPSLLNEIPIDRFGELLLDVPSQYPNMKAFFPSMPPDDVQDSWTGNHGLALLGQSLAFTKTLVAGYQDLTGRDLKSSRVLDYGCGWGRLIRLLYKYVPYERIYGVDPWDKSIDLCTQYGIKANLAICDYVPDKLPFEQQFDLIFAFSVFTHLSEKTAKTVLSTLRKYIDDHGILVITVRPQEYWSHYQRGRVKNEMYQIHEKDGFAFIPHRRAPINGDITYGDASISLGYLEQNFPQWDVARVITNRVDPLQTVVFLRPK
jgi:SAM-dependent methyltransferase